MSLDHIYGGGGIADDVGCIWDFMVKNAIARSRTAIHISKNPKPNAMIKMAPMKRSRPEVPNNPTFVLSDTCFNERLTKNVAIIAETQITIKTTAKNRITPAMRGKTSDGLRLAVVGVKPESVDQSPFQPG